MMEFSRYYSDPDVRARIVEFLGGPTLETASSVFISRCDPSSAQIGMDFKLPEELDYFLSNGLDLSRSLWDRESLIAHIDLEYVNFDFQAEAYLDPVRTYALQRPAEWAIEELLLRFHIAPLHILSGRGHHFIWKIARNSMAFEQLMRAGKVPRHLYERYAGKHPPAGISVDRELAEAYSGLGLVMDYISFLVKDQARCGIPVEISAIEVPMQERGREMISIDTTEYGDLLHTRVIRVPYTLYLKPWERYGILHDEIREKVPPMVCIPLFEMDTFQGIEMMRNTDKALALARRAPVLIPDMSSSSAIMIDEYRHSEVSHFHSWYYSVEQEPPELWPHTYDRLPLDILPECTRRIIASPNDSLLKPAGMRHLVRVLMSYGWHPRHIAGLMRSKFERDYGWGREWYFYDAAMRADHYARVFSGLIGTGRDRLEDFACYPEHAPNGEEQRKIEDIRKSLLERVTHERLACRPVNGLFLPDKHL